MQRQTSLMVGRYAPIRIATLFGKSHAVEILPTLPQRRNATNVYTIDRDAPPPPFHSIRMKIQPREKKIRTKKGKYTSDPFDLDYKEVLKVYDVYRKQGHKFNMLVFKEYLNCCVGLSSINEPEWADKAFSIFEDMKSDGHSADLQTYVLLIQASARARQLDRALMVNEWIDRDKMERDQLAYCALIRACGIADEKDKAHEFFDAMIKSGQAASYIEFEKLYIHLRNL